MVKQKGGREGKEVCMRRNEQDFRALKFPHYGSHSEPDFLRYPQVKFWDKIKFALGLFLVPFLASFSSKHLENLAIWSPHCSQVSAGL